MLPVLFSLFFLSGATSLLYQILWIRLLSLSLGSTVLAISWVVSCFMAGLALGSEFLGRLADRGASPIRLYALLEGAIGLSALGVSMALSHLAHTALPVAVGYGLAALLLAVPTFLMGGTLPVLSRYAERRLRDKGGLIGALYGVNTLGAIVGVALTGFVLIRAFGILHTTWIAAAANIGIAVIGLLLARGDVQPSNDGGSGTSVPAKRAQPAAGKSQATDRVLHAVAITYFMNGLVGLALEILWTRSVLLIGANTIYVFTTILTTFLLGLALGSALLSLRVDRLRAPGATLSNLQSAIGLAAGLSPLLLRLVATPAFRSLSERATPHGLAAQAFSTYALTVLLILPTAILLGACFPVVARLVAERETNIGRRIGRVYALNTVGAVAGSLLAGFVLLPALGIERSIALVAVLAAVSGLHLATRVQTSRVMGGVCAAVACAALVFAPGQFRRLLESGLRQPLSFYREGTETTAGVYTSAKAGRPVLVINNVALDDHGVVHKLLAHIPGLLQERTERALVLGFGVGITSQSVSTLGYTVNDCVEISPEVMAAAPSFALLNGNIAGRGDPHYRTIVADGRRYLLANRTAYDLIALDANSGKLLNAGVGKLYTREFFALCKSRLAPGGMVTAYVSPNVSWREFKMIVRTFQEVFPHTTLWTDPVYRENCVLVGTEMPLRIDLTRYAERLARPEVQADLAAFDLDQIGFLGGFLMGENHVRLFSRDGELNTDDHPIMEFFSLRRDLFEVDDRPTIASGLPLFGESLRTLIDPAADASGTALLAAVDGAERAAPLLAQAAEYRHLRNLDAMRERFFAAKGVMPESRVIARLIAELPKKTGSDGAVPELDLAASNSAGRTGADQLLADPPRGFGLASTFVQAYRQTDNAAIRGPATQIAARCLDALEDPAGALVLYRALGSIDATNGEAKTRAQAATVAIALRLDAALKSGDTAAAVRSPYLGIKISQTQVEPRDFARADGWLELAQLEALSNRPIDAYLALRAARTAEPNRAETYVALGQSVRGLGAIDAARAAFERALELDPGLTRARDELARTPSR